MGPLPLGAWILAHRLAGSPVLIGVGATRELLFFALTTAGSGLLSLSENQYPGRQHLWGFPGLLLTIVSAVIYGELVIGEALHAAMRVRYAYNISQAFAVGALVYGALLEVTIQLRPHYDSHADF